MWLVCRAGYPLLRPPPVRGEGVAAEPGHDRKIIGVMLRLVEVALFLTPFAVVAIWRLLLLARGPSIRLVVALGMIVVLLAGTLLWLRGEDAEPPTAIYIPSHMQNGRIVPSSDAPR